MTDIYLFLATEMLRRDYEEIVRKEKNRLASKNILSVKGNFFGRTKQETSLSGRVSSEKNDHKKQDC